MKRIQLITWAISIVMGAIALGIGIWYMSNAISGGSLTYTSLDGFLRSIGACNGNICDIADANGCFLCEYIGKLFESIGNITAVFWNALIENLWIIMAAGFGIYLFIHSFDIIWKSTKETATLDAKEKKLDFKEWFEPVWKLAVRILIAGAFLGAVGFGGVAVLQTVVDITVTPVMYVGSHLAMAATGISDAATCGAGYIGTGIMGPVMQPFMCVIGNLNSVMLAGAAGGFSLMNYAWLGLGGGLFTWLAGLCLIIMFLVIGFRLFFDILNVVFQLVFVIIFLPMFVAAAAFKDAWKMMGGVVSNIISMIAKCAVKVVAISLNTVIIYTMVSYAADQFFPGPIDGYSAITVPGIAGNNSGENLNSESRAGSISLVFSKCEKASIINGEVDKKTFAACFNAEKASVERTHPGAFDFIKDGWSFMMLMIGLFAVYFYAVEPKVKSLLGVDKNSGGAFSYGTYVKELGTSLWQIPKKIGAFFTSRMKK